MHPPLLPPLPPSVPDPLACGLSVREEDGRWVVRLERGGTRAQEYACPTRAHAERLLALLMLPARPPRAAPRS